MTEVCLNRVEQRRQEVAVALEHLQKITLIGDEEARDFSSAVARSRFLHDPRDLYVRASETPLAKVG
jgi:hypothetical protein